MEMVAKKEKSHMKKEELVRKFYMQKEEKELFLEKLIFCNFSEQRDFENYFKVGELEESELFYLISFLYHEDCFFMMLEILNNYKQHFHSAGVFELEEFDFSEKLLKRWERMEKLQKINGK